MDAKAMLAVLLAGSLLVAACGAAATGGNAGSMAPASGPMGGSGGSTVHMSMNMGGAGAQNQGGEERFTPPVLTVPVGTTVTWLNDDDMPHTVTAGTRSRPGGLFDSGTLKPGDKFQFAFTKAGTYPYFCAFHPGMDGKIVVK